MNRIWWLGLVIGLITPVEIYAQESVCAVAKFVIEQELTLERQGFEGRMTIDNDSPFGLEGVKVSLLFYDEDENAVSATTDPSNAEGPLFFFRDMDGGLVGDVDIAVGASKSFTFTIVPAPDAGGESSSGVLYSIGALLSYASDGKDESIKVQPDDILVLPMPKLRLDYFFPSEVVADDPSTPAKEPSEPFDYVLRVSNVGYADAQNLKLASNQPQITDNPNGLLIDFNIVGNHVDDVPSEKTLLANFGTIASGDASVARWLLTSSLSGRITEVNAEVRHADELGGEVTSLIDTFNTYRLIGSVRDDVPSLISDDVLDVLAIGSDGVTSLSPSIFSADLSNVALVPALKLFRSNDPLVLSVENFSNAMSVEVVSSSNWKLRLSSIPSSPDTPVYVRMNDPSAGTLDLASVVRGDGKLLARENVWFNRKNIGPGQWEYYLNFYDTGLHDGLEVPVEYNLTLQPRSSDNVAPTIEDTAIVLATVSNPMEIAVRGVDFDGPISPLKLNSPGILPSGMGFVDNEDGTATIAWTPPESALGKSIPVVVEVFDGIDKALKTIDIRIIGESEVLASWRSAYWPGVDDQVIVGNFADPDGDQLSNLLEYALNLDPTDVTSDGLPVLTVFDDSQNKKRLALEVIIRENDPLLDIYGIVSADANLSEANWTSIPSSNNLDSIDQTNVPVGFKRILILDVETVTAAGPRRYMKVRVARDDGN